MIYTPNFSKSNLFPGNNFASFKRNEVAQWILRDQKEEIRLRSSMALDSQESQLKWQRKSLFEKKKEEFKAANKRENDKRANSLKLLYESEETKWKKEIELLVQRNSGSFKPDLLQKVEKFRLQKEQNRVEFVAAQKERQLRESSDELRLVNSRVNALKTLTQNDLLMMEKQKRMQSQFHENIVFAEAFKREGDRLEKLEQSHLSERKRTMEASNLILGLQRNSNEEQRRKEREMKLLENKMMKEQWEEQLRKSQAQEKEQKELFKAMSASLMQKNREEQEKKRKELEMEKEKEKQAVFEVLEREKRLLELDRLKAAEKRQDTLSFMMNVGVRNNQRNELNREIENYQNEEMRKKEKMEDEKWRREDLKRIERMHDVYEQRASLLWKKSKKTERSNWWGSIIQRKQKETRKKLKKKRKEKGKD